MPNRLEFVLGLFAIAKVGAVAVPINARFKTHELSQIIDHADVRLLLTSGAHRARRTIRRCSGSSASQHGCRSSTSTRPGTSSWTPGATSSEAQLRERQQRVRVRDVAILMYTSGTSARPKGCLLTHEALVRHGANVAATRFDLTADDSFWDPLPLFHIGGIVPMLGCFSAGAKFCHAGHFDAGRGAADARGRAVHRDLPGVRDDLARGARPPGLRGAPT